MDNGRIGLCKGCRKNRNLTEHHVIPRRLKTPDRRRVYLCRECHDELEEAIFNLEQALLLENEWIYLRLLVGHKIVLAPD